MPTQDDIFFARQMQQLAANIRGGFKQKQALEEKDIDFQRATEARGQQQQFTTGERVAGQEFRAGQSELERVADKEREQIRATRGAETQINIDTGLRTQQEQTASFARAGIIELDEETGQQTVSGVLGTSTGQAKALREVVIDLSGKTDAEFESSKQVLTKNGIDLAREAKRKGIATPLGKWLQVKKGEGLAEYVQRLRGLRKKLIDREVVRRVKKEQKGPNFGRPITGGTRGGATFGSFSKTVFDRDTAIITRRITDEVSKEFGDIK